MEDEDPNKILKVIEKELTRVKFSCFGKVTHSSKSKDDKELEKLQTQKIRVMNNISLTDKENKVEEINNEISKTLSKIQSKQFNRDIKELENLKENKGKAAANFRLKEKLMGKKEEDRNL